MRLRSRRSMSRRPCDRRSARLIVTGSLCLSGMVANARAVSSSEANQLPFVAPLSLPVPHLDQAAADSFFLEAPAVEVWAALVRVYEQLGIPATISERAGGQLGNLQFRPRRNRIGRDRLSRYVDCGEGVLGANADHYDVTLSLVSTLRRRGESGMLLFTQLTGSAKPKSTRGDDVGCTSKRSLEQRIGMLVVEAVRARSDSTGAVDAALRGESPLHAARRVKTRHRELP